MPVLTDCCWRVSAASSLFPALPSSLIDKAPSLTFTKCLFTKWEKFGSKTTRAESKGDLCSPQTLQKTASSSLSSFFFFISLAFHNPATPSPSFFFQIHFLSPHLFSKRLDWESGTLPPPPPPPPPHPSTRAIPLEHQYTTEPRGPNRRKAEENSATPIHNGFSSLFHSLPAGRCSGGTTGTEWETRGRRGEQRRGEREREGRQRLKTVSITKALNNISLICLRGGLRNMCFKLFCKAKAHSRRWQECKAALVWLPLIRFRNCH